MNPKEFVKEYSIRSLVIGFSGGKDSLCATHYTLSELSDLPELLKPTIYVVHVDTTVALPGVQDYVKEVCNRFNWPLVLLRPEKDFETEVQSKGMPSMRRRWCCFYLKLKPFMDFTAKLPPQRAEITGLRRAESIRRSKMKEVFYNRKGHVWKYAPIIDWSDDDIKHYIRKHNLPTSPVSKLIGHSGECLCGVFASVKSLNIIKANYPDFFNRFVELEKQFRSGGAAFFLHNKPLRASDLMKQKCIEEWMK